MVEEFASAPWEFILNTCTVVLLDTVEMAAITVFTTSSHQVVNMTVQRWIKWKGDVGPCLVRDFATAVREFILHTCTVVLLVIVVMAAITARSTSNHQVVNMTVQRWIKWKGDVGPCLAGDFAIAPRDLISDTCTAKIAVLVETLAIATRRLLFVMLLVALIVHRWTLPVVVAHCSEGGSVTVVLSFSIAMNLMDTAGTPIQSKMLRRVRNTIVQVTSKLYVPLSCCCFSL
mmetsp:Transcript_42218/g.102004  ORF Transcript_42218/g.102004 Transcript_42218/m.102004 type:complete len:231 (-) Transcript_42218:1012-1704(-)